jgi:hypothetical protein
MNIVSLLQRGCMRVGMSNSANRGEEVLRGDTGMRSGSEIGYGGCWCHVVFLVLFNFCMCMMLVDGVS